MAVKISTFLLLFLSQALWAQSSLESEFSEDLGVGGDIFSDFNDDVEASQVMEDEKFYRYSRFFGVNLGLGLTTFTGNRGRAYNDSHPSFNFSLIYFMDFQNAFVMGMAYSRHVAFIDSTVSGSKSELLGAIDTSFLRPYFGFRYYLDTSDLGTALTYSNPYFIGRVEYWYHTNKFPDNPTLEDESQGALGTGVGFGLEFPIELKKTYFNIEFLYHTVNFFDKYSSDYNRVPDNDQTTAGNPLSTNGYVNLFGDAITLFFNYHISW